MDNDTIWVVEFVHQPILYREGETPGEGPIQFVTPNLPWPVYENLLRGIKGRLSLTALQLRLYSLPDNKSDPDHQLVVSIGMTARRTLNHQIL